MSAKELQFNIIGRRKIWFTISALLVIGSILFLSFSGLRLGIDFTGGSLLEVVISPSADISAERISETIQTQLPEVPEVKVQASGDREGQFIVRSTALSEDEHLAIISTISGMTYSNPELEIVAEGAEITGGEVLSNVTVEELRFESIGPTLGQELKDKALIALIVAAIFIIIYIAITFRHVSKPVQSWKYGVGAIIALVHDVLIVTGLFSLVASFTEYQMDALFVTALLVTLGYSVNDTIVVYDRVRENVLKAHISSFEKLVNKSVNQTIMRSINTSVTTLLILLTLFFFGGVTIQGFVLTLILGIVVGTYSSIFLASPVLVAWEKFSKK